MKTASLSALVQERNSTSDVGPSVWLTISLCFIVDILEGIDFQAPGIAAPGMAQAFVMDKVRMGWVLSAGILGLLPGALCGGWLAWYAQTSHCSAGGTKPPQIPAHPQVHAERGAHGEQDHQVFGIHGSVPRPGFLPDRLDVRQSDAQMRVVSEGR